MDGDDDDSRAAAQRAEARGTLEKLQGQQEKSRNTAPDNSSGDLTDRETEGELHRARTVLHDLEFQEDQEEDPKARAKETPTHPLVQRAAVYSNLVTFSILGAVTRIGLTRLCTYPGQAVFATAVSQAVGCAVMGLVVRNKSLLESM